MHVGSLKHITQGVETNILTDKSTFHKLCDRPYSARDNFACPGYKLGLPILISRLFIVQKLKGKESAKQHM